MSGVTLEDLTGKRSAWNLQTNHKRLNTPLPSRKAMLLAEEKTVFDWEERPQLKVAHRVRKASINGSQSRDMGTTSLNDVEIHYSADKPLQQAWNLYDYLVVLGVLLVLFGLVVPFITGDKSLAIALPAGAACIGAGTFLARRSPA